MDGKVPAPRCAGTRRRAWLSSSVVAVMASVVAWSAGVANAHGIGLTLKQATAAVNRQLPLRASITSCWDPNCYENEYGEIEGGTRTLVKVQSMRARIVGKGPYRVVNGARRWRHYRVRGCGWVYSMNTAVSFDVTYHGGTEIGYGNDPFPELTPIDDC